MLWKTHLRICNWICEDLGLPRGASKIIKDSVVIPDKWKDYPHHHGKGRTIRKYILEARKSFLNNDFQNTYYHLGIAFHYIQDAYTSFYSRSRNSRTREEWHKKYEQWIEDARFAEDLDLLIAQSFKNDLQQQQYWTSIVDYGSQQIEGKEATLQLATLNQGKKSRRNTRRENPRVDLNMAHFVSLQVAKSILGSKRNPTLQHQLEQNLQEHQIKLQDREIEFANELMGTLRKRDQARQATGFLGSITRSLIGGYHNWLAKSRLQQYEENAHLQQVVKAYDSSTSQITRPHREWYSITPPHLDISHVPKRLNITLNTEPPLSVKSPNSYDIDNKTISERS